VNTESITPLPQTWKPLFHQSAETTPLSSYLPSADFTVAETAQEDFIFLQTDRLLKSLISGFLLEHETDNKSAFH
jgi:hypothetical protein